MTGTVLTDEALDQLFRTARTGNVWTEQPVGDDLLRKIHDLAKFGATSANSCPMRVVFVKTKEAKERLKPALLPGNVEKTMKAPVTAIFGYDLQFYEHLPRLFPHTDAKAWFVGNDKLIAETAFRNGTLQAAYFMLAARAYGLDCGPMSGFDQNAVNKEFFPDGKVKSNFICSLGYADQSKTFPRGPRFAFDEICRIA